MDNFYSQAIEFFVENGIKLNEDQILALQEKGEEEKEIRADRKDRKKFSKLVSKETKKFFKAYGSRFSASVDCKAFEQKLSNNIIVTLTDTSDLTATVWLGPAYTIAAAARGGSTEKVAKFEAFLKANPDLINKLKGKLNKLSGEFQVSKIDVTMQPRGAMFTIDIKDK